jgi:uroporphyrinogen decarboxylase
MPTPITSFWNHHPGFDQDGRRLAERTLAFQDQADCDFIKITPAGTWQAVCHGAVDEDWPNDPLGRRRISKPRIEGPEDWLDLPDFQSDTPALMKDMLACCRSVVMSSAAKPVVFTLFNPITQAIQLSGLERFQEHCLLVPDMVKAGIERITVNTLHAIDAFMATGARGAYYVTQHMQSGLISPDLYHSFGAEGDRLCMSKCGGLDFPIFHIHGEDVFLALPEMPADCIVHYEYTEANLHPAAFHAEYPYRLMLGIPVAVMKSCRSDDEIASCIRHHLDLDPGAEFFVAGCVLPLDFPEAVIRRWVEAIKTFHRDGA